MTMFPDDSRLAKHPAARCPCCGRLGVLYLRQSLNKLSRYRKDQWICADCGTREAFAGERLRWACD